MHVQNKGHKNPQWRRMRDWEWTINHGKQKP